MTNSPVKGNKNNCNITATTNSDKNRNSMLDDKGSVTVTLDHGDNDISAISQDINSGLNAYRSMIQEQKTNLEVLESQTAIEFERISNRLARIRTELKGVTLMLDRIDGNFNNSNNNSSLNQKDDSTRYTTTGSTTNDNVNDTNVQSSNVNRSNGQNNHNNGNNIFNHPNDNMITKQQQQEQEMKQKFSSISDRLEALESKFNSFPTIEEDNEMIDKLTKQVTEALQLKRMEKDESTSNDSTAILLRIDELTKQVEAIETKTETVDSIHNMLQETEESNARTVAHLTTKIVDIKSKIESVFEKVEHIEPTFEAIESIEVHTREPYQELLGKMQKRLSIMGVFKKIHNVVGNWNNYLKSMEENGIMAGRQILLQPLLFVCSSRRDLNEVETVAYYLSEIMFTLGINNGKNLYCLSTPFYSSLTLDVDKAKKRILLVEGWFNAQNAFASRASSWLARAQTNGTLVIFFEYHNNYKRASDSVWFQRLVEDMIVINCCAANNEQK